MKGLNYLLIFFVLFLFGCTNKPTVHVYAKYLDDIQRNEIIDSFEQSTKYHVEINEFDFPATIEANTLLYSLLLRESETINIASDISASAGFPIQRIQALTQGNHWYTKDSVALFLIPKNRDRTSTFFPQDLVNKYIGKNCDTTTYLTLNKNRSFQLVIEAGGNRNVGEVINGIWKYRQYPFLELQREGADYSEDYFEIKQFRESDKVSQIDFVELISLSTGNLVKGCSFLFGRRI
tara:strand:- start:29 stop:736 length:708 start_codon:yes stop_codon:yes gene_type:complete